MKILNAIVYSSSTRISRFIRFLMFLYLANKIKEAAKKKADEEKKVNNIVKLVTKKINSGVGVGVGMVVIFVGTGGCVCVGGGGGGGVYWVGGEGFTNNRRRI